MQYVKYLWKYKFLRPVLKFIAFGNDWKELYYQSMLDTVVDLNLLQACGLNVTIAKDSNAQSLFFHEMTYKQVKEGRDINHIYKDFFPSSEAQLLAGGAVGNDKALPYKLALDYSEQTIPLKEKIYLAYISLFFYSALVSFFLLFIFPQSVDTLNLFKEMIPNIYDNDENITMFLNFNVVFDSVKYFVLAGLVLIVIWVLWYLPRKPTRIRVWFDNHIFPFGFYRKSGSTIFLKTFAALLNSGLKESQALKEAGIYAKPYFKYYINIMLKRSLDGRNPAEVYKVGLFSNSTRASLLSFIAATDSVRGINRIADMEIKQLIRTSDSVMRSTKLFGMAAVALLIILVFSLNYWLVADVQEYSSRVSAGF